MLITIIRIAFNVYYVLIIISVFLSWFRLPSNNFIVSFIRDTTDPFLNFFRRLLPLNFGGLDFTPIIALIALQILESILIRILYLF